MVRNVLTLMLPALRRRVRMHAGSTQLRALLSLSRSADSCADVNDAMSPAKVKEIDI